MLNKPLPQQIYRHFKGNLYRIVILAKHSETGEELVIYQALYGDYQVYARPLSMFFEKVDREKYPDAPQEYRFELVKELLPVPNMPQPAETASRETAAQQSDGQTTEQSGKEPSGQLKVQEAEQLKRQETEQSIEQEKINIDPLVLEFLDADSYEERLNILAALHHRITDEMINTMAVSIDLEVKEGDTQERYEELKNCLLTLEKYECNRLR